MEDYIIKTSINILDVIYGSNNLLYIATSQYLNALGPDTRVHFYSNVNGQEGLIATGIMLDFPVLSRYVPADYQEHLYAKELRQFPLHITMVREEIFFDKKHLHHLPAMNMYHKTEVVRFDYLYDVFDMGSQLDFIMNKKVLFCYRENDSELTEGHYRLWFHQLREQVFECRLNYPVLTKNSCKLCRMIVGPDDGYGKDFFEYHEKVDINFDEKYRRISKGNYIIVCPNCHKKEHEKILNSSSEKAD
jgi:hypothetical protein